MDIECLNCAYIGAIARRKLMAVDLFIGQLITAVIGIIIAFMALCSALVSGPTASCMVGGGTDAPDPATHLITLATKEIAGRDIAPQFEYAQLGRLPYMHGTRVQKQGCHAGQRKLLLSEIEFLSTCGGRDAEGLTIYVGSAPCEKLPVLLDLFPRRRFLLIDPNFHTFTVPKGTVMYVYQAVDRISSDTLRKLRGDLRLAERSRPSVEDRKRAENAALNVKPTIYRQSETRANMSDDSAAHKAEMHRVEAEFVATHHKTMVGDLLNGVARVFIIQDYMTEALCRLIRASIEAAGNPHVLFISDLRTNLFGSAPVDLDFMWNDAIQLIFLRLLRPTWSMLKFHPPYMDYKTSDPLIAEMTAGSKKHPMYDAIRTDLKTAADLGLDFLADYARHDGRYRYIASTTIWLQAWAPTASSEARLVIANADLDAPFMIYDAAEWDDKFTYNKYMRNYAYYGAFGGGRPGDATDGCFDCCLEALILLNYATRQGDEKEGMIDVARIVSAYADPAVRERLAALRQQLDDVLIYRRDAKCQFHGQIRGPNEAPVFYVLRGNTTASTVDQMWVEPSGRVESQPILDLNCKAKTYAYKPRVNLTVGQKIKNVDRNPERLKRYAQRCLKVCSEEED
jgi:hypothetical protein